MLRNPLASPDIIGISSGASAAAVVAIVIFKLDETAVSLLAIVAALATAMVTYLLSFRGGVVGTRLILIGIGDRRDARQRRRLRHRAGRQLGPARPRCAG